MKEFQCKIASSDKLFYEGPCVSLVIPAWDGEFAFLANHEECITSVSYGELRVTRPDGEVIRAVTGLGFVRFENNQALLLADIIERPEDIDEVLARKQKEAEEEERKEIKSQQEYNISQAAISRALARYVDSAKNKKYR